jgi:TonB-dependent receptor
VQSARADRREPDLRESLYQRAQNTNNAFVLADESQSNFRMFNTLNDDTVDGALNWSLASTVNGLPVQFKFGPSYVKRTRDFSSRRFRYVPTNLVSTVDLSQSPEELLTADNIGSVFRLVETTRPTDAYDAEQTTAAVYGMTDWALSATTRLAAGVRVEKFKEQVNSFDPFGLFVDRVQAKLENTDVFPAVNFVVAARPDQNVRVSFSQTVNRPEFRELAQFEFTDVIGNRAVRGNPDLQRALIQNVDVRYEAFTGSRGVLAASVFFKRFSDPIERVINAGAEPLATFENADKARNVGLELEAARSFGDNVFLSANYAFVDSRITLTDSAIRVQTSSERPLAGQSKHLFNLAAEVSGGGFSARALVNFVGDRISDVGAGGAPDVIENGRGSLDMVFSQRIARALNIKLTLDNLTDSEYLYTQGGKDQRSYKLGRTVGISLGYSFF